MGREYVTPRELAEFLRETDDRDLLLIVQHPADVRRWAENFREELVSAPWATPLSLESVPDHLKAMYRKYAVPAKILGWDGNVAWRVLKDRSFLHAASARDLEAGDGPRIAGEHSPLVGDEMVHEGDIIFCLPVKGIGFGATENLETVLRTYEREYKIRLRVPSAAMLFVVMQDLLRGNPSHPPECRALITSTTTSIVAGARKMTLNFQHDYRTCDADPMNQRFEPRSDSTYTIYVSTASTGGYDCWPCHIVRAK